MALTDCELWNHHLFRFKDQRHLHLGIIRYIESQAQDKGFIANAFTVLKFLASISPTNRLRYDSSQTSIAPPGRLLHHFNTTERKWSSNLRGCMFLQGFGYVGSIACIKCYCSLNCETNGLLSRTLGCLCKKQTSCNTCSNPPDRNPKTPKRLSLQINIRFLISVPICNNSLGNVPLPVSLHTSNPLASPLPPQCLLSSPYQMSSCRRRAGTAYRCARGGTVTGRRPLAAANTDLRRHPAHGCLTGTSSLSCNWHRHRRRAAAACSRAR